MKTKAKALEFIEWQDKETGMKLFGTVRKVMENAVIVDVIGTDQATVVSHKRYRVIEEVDVDAGAGEQFQRACIKMGRKKWF